MSSDWLLFYLFKPKIRKNEMVELVALSTNKIHEKDSLAVLNHFTKGALTNSFRRDTFDSLLYKQKISKTEIGTSTRGIYQ